jgi:hypothetical protein
VLVDLIANSTDGFDAFQATISLSNIQNATFASSIMTGIVDVNYTPDNLIIGGIGVKQTSGEVILGRLNIAAGLAASINLNMSDILFSDENSKSFSAEPIDGAFQRASQDFNWSQLANNQQISFNPFYNKLVFDSQDRSTKPFICLAR